MHDDRAKASAAGMTTERENQIQEIRQARRPRSTSVDVGGHAVERLRCRGQTNRGPRPPVPGRDPRRPVHGPLVILLIVASVVAIAAGDQVDASIILVIVVVSAGLGFVQEARRRTRLPPFEHDWRSRPRSFDDGAEQ